MPRVYTGYHVQYSKQCQCTAGPGTSHLVPAVQARLALARLLSPVTADTMWDLSPGPQVSPWPLHHHHQATADHCQCRNLGHAVTIVMILLVSVNQTFVRRLNVPIYRKTVPSFVAKVISVLPKHCRSWHEAESCVFVSEGRGQDGETQWGHDRGEDQGQWHEPGQEAQLLGRRALRHLRHQEAQERRGAVTQVRVIMIAVIIQCQCVFQCQQYLHSSRHSTLPKFARIVHPQELHPWHQRDLLPERLAATEESLAGGESLRWGGQWAVQADCHQEQWCHELLNLFENLNSKVRIEPFSI